MKKLKNRLALEAATPINNKKTIVCLKWGTKYPVQYVNVLHRMVRRHSVSEFDFVCLTEDPRGLDHGIIHKTLPNINAAGWWMKPYVFSRNLGFQGDVLFLDLDIVVFENIDKLWTYNPANFCIIRDFTRHMNPSWRKFNSSVFRFPAEDFYWIWDEFEKDHKKIMPKNHGDQDYLYSLLNQQARCWPDEWIQSYKWEMRNRSELGIVGGKRNFVFTKDPKLDPNCFIAVFHGEPNPHDCRDPWVINNWN